MGVDDTELVEIADKKFGMKDLVSLVEQMKTKGKLTQRKEDGSNLELSKRYPDSFWGKFGDGGKVVDVQLATKENNGTGSVVTYEDTFKLDHKVKVVGRVWVTDTTGGKEGKGNAACFSLGEDGKWYMQEATNYKKDVDDSGKDKKTNVWGLGKAKDVSENIRALLVNGVLEASNGDEVKAKDASKQDQKVTITVAAGSRVTVS